MTSSAELHDYLVTQIRARIGQRRELKALSLDDAMEQAKVMFVQFFEQWPHRISLLAFLNRARHSIFWEIHQNGRRELNDVYGILDQVQSSRLFEKDPSRKERFALPSTSELDRVVEILIWYWTVRAHFGGNHWLERFRIEPIQRIHTRYGAQFVEGGRLRNLPALRRLMLARFRSLIGPADPSLRLKEAIARLITPQHSVTGLLLPDVVRRGQEEADEPPRSLLQTFEKEINEGGRVLFYYLTLQMMEIPRTSGFPAFADAFAVAEEILLTYRSYVRDNGFAGMHMGNATSHFWRFWAVHDLLFSFGQHDAGATSYLTSKVLPQNSDRDMKKAAFCNLALHLPSFIKKFANLTTLEVNRTAYGRLIAELPEKDRQHLAQSFLIEEPGTISYEFCQEFLDWISDVLPKHRAFPPHKIRPPINIVPSVLRGEGGMRINAHQLTANWFFEKVYSEAGYPAKEIGPRFEKVIRDMIIALGGNAMSGFYAYKDTIYETDCVLADADRILIFEMKTKPFTKLARTGDLGALFADFLQMFLKSQTQGLRLWLALMSLGSVKLYASEQEARRAKSPVAEVSLDERNVYSLTVIPFAPDFLTQTILTGHLIETFSTKRITFHPNNAILDKLQDDYQLVLADLVQILQPDDALQIVTTRSNLYTFAELYAWARVAGSIDRFVELVAATLHMQSYDYRSHAKILSAVNMCAHRWASSDKGKGAGDR